MIKQQNFFIFFYLGDHQQLRPKVNNYSLVTKKKFDISLFERLAVTRGVESLSVQSRMHPDLSKLVRLFYPEYTDGESVLNREGVAGVGSRVFWLNHNHQEDSWGSNGGSKYNSFEAKFAWKLAAHLICQSGEPENITILTPYNGQKRLIKRLLESNDVFSKNEKESLIDDLRMVKVVTIDDYQGDENDIIILSLVRSNPEYQLGFCGIENRITVALSRARCGLYILGDATTFSKDKNWSRVQNVLKENGWIGDRMPLVRHQKSSEFTAANLNDFYELVNPY